MWETYLRYLPPTGRHSDSRLRINALYNNDRSYREGCVTIETEVVKLTTAGKKEIGGNCTHAQVTGYNAANGNELGGKK